ncbi:hypothetical protein K438DRAFT_1784190 [Mycena galopus ATCC 62051]|nr:hypothetical protein K438DRAFT_1784190 [Mycena galopus ATCC 62051]
MPRPPLRLLAVPDDWVLTPAAASALTTAQKLDIIHGINVLVKTIHCKTQTKNNSTLGVNEHNRLNAELRQLKAQLEACRALLQPANRTDPPLYFNLVRTLKFGTASAMFILVLVLCINAAPSVLETLACDRDAWQCCSAILPTRRSRYNQRSLVSYRLIVIRGTILDLLSSRGSLKSLFQLCILDISLNLDKASPAARYLIAAVGPPPPSFQDRCPKDSSHHIAIYSASAERKQAQVTETDDIESTVTGEASQLKNFATYTVFLPRWSSVPTNLKRVVVRSDAPPPLHPERRLALLQGLQALEATIFPQLARQDKLQIAIEMGTTAQHAWMATAGLLGEHPVAKPTAIAANPKGKAKATAPTATKVKAKDAPQHPVPLKVEYGRWSKLVYATEGMPTRMITLIFYERANAPPTFGSAFLRFLGCFHLCDLGIAQRVHAVDGHRSMQYERYSVFERAFTPADPNQPINMIDRGCHLLFKAASLQESECPKIAHWKATAQASAAPAMDSDDSDGEDDFHSDSDLEIVAESCFSSSQLPSSSATTGSSRTKSVIRNSAIASLFKLRSSSATTASKSDSPDSAIASSSRLPFSSPATASSSTLVKRKYSHAFKRAFVFRDHDCKSTISIFCVYGKAPEEGRSKSTPWSQIRKTDKNSGNEQSTDPSKTLKQKSDVSQKHRNPLRAKKRKSSGAPESPRQKIKAAEAKERRICRDELCTRRAEMARAWDAAGDSRQLVAEAKLREWKLILEGPCAVEALPQTINIEFPFIVKCLNPNEFTEYSDALFGLHLLKDEVLRL